MPPYVPRQSSGQGEHTEAGQNERRCGAWSTPYAGGRVGHAAEAGQAKRAAQLRGALEHRLTAGGQRRDATDGDPGP